jgi:hypothetical protein
VAPVMLSYLSASRDHPRLGDGSENRNPTDNRQDRWDF